MKYKITGNKITPIAFDFLTLKNGASIPIGVAIIKINNPKNPVNKTTISASPMSTPMHSLE